MILYKVGTKGGLSKVKNVSFNRNEIYIIDDYKNIYIWFGKSTNANYKDSSIKIAKKLKKERENRANIQIMDQDEEYGAFLALKDVLDNIGPAEDDTERRAELEIEYDDTLELLEIGLEPDFEANITVAAQDLADQGKSYKELCEILAEIQLKLVKGNKKPSKLEIQEKSAEIYSSSTTYEELCWLIAEMGEIEQRLAD